MGWRIFYFLLLNFASAYSVPRIAWTQDDDSDSEPWNFIPDESPSRLKWKCKEPRNLPEQFMKWFRESQSDPTMLTFMSDITAHSSSSRTSRMAELRREEPELCGNSPSTALDSDLMDRALCPWEWNINREDNREPKLISEARCLCRTARGGLGAQCVPIRREFPVLKRVYCDETNGSFEYVRAFQTVTVGCHSVMPRTARAPPLSHRLRALHRRHHKDGN